jgi:cytochrome c6
MMNRLRSGLLWGLIGVWGVMLGILNPSVALADPPVADPPAALFEFHCAGCHPNGSNIVRRGKSLQPKALKRHGVDSVAAIATLITQGKGLMSAYGDRLSPDEIQTLASYVWERSQDHWQ